MTQKASKNLNLFLNEDFTNDLETLMMLFFVQEENEGMLII